MKALHNLKSLVEQLKDPKSGDPWIRAQDFKSLVTLTLEEVYEFADSVEQLDYHAMCDELGDLLLHLFLYAKIAEELKQFNLTDIANGAINKQQRRKLSFADAENASAKEALQQWEKKKLEERAIQGFESALDGIAASLPSLNRAVKLQLQAAQTGFDWPNAEPIFAKFAEEVAEIHEAIELNHSKEKLADEIGDLLFTCVNLARHFEINPDSALRHANNKFEKRFRLLEKALAEQGKKLNECALEEMDVIWERVKKT